MITRVNEFRHRMGFRLWCGLVGLRLRRVGGRLIVDAPHGARMDSWPHVHVGGPGTVTLRLGRGVRLGRATHLDLSGDGTLELDDGAVLWHGVRLQLDGGAISLAVHTEVRDGVVLKSRGRLTVGRETVLSYGVVVHCAERIDIGEYVGVGERVSVLDSDHTHHRDERLMLKQPVKVTPVTIGRNVLIGANSVILRGGAGAAERGRARRLNRPRWCGTLGRAPERREVVRPEQVSGERLGQRVGQRLHRLGDRPLVGGHDLLARRALTSVELGHLGRGVAGLHHDEALGAAQLHEQLTALALLRRSGWTRSEPQLGHVGRTGMARRYGHSRTDPLNGVEGHAGPVLDRVRRQP